MADKKVFIATYKPGLKEPTRVFAKDSKDAMKAAFAAYAYTTSMGFRNLKPEDVVESVKRDPDQVMRGNGMQPSVQVGCMPPTAAEILKEQFPRRGPDGRRDADA